MPEDSPLLHLYSLQTRFEDLKLYIPRMSEEELTIFAESICAQIRDLIDEMERLELERMLEDSILQRELIGESPERLRKLRLVDRLENAETD